MISIILAAAVGLTIFVLTMIYYHDIIEWFQSREDLVGRDKDNIAFTIKQRLKKGQYKVVQGVFNKGTDRVVTGKVMKSKKLDRKLADVHESDDLAIYN